MANTSNLANTSVVPAFSRLSPYYDDYEDLKNFYRMLFSPGWAVQGRELNQMQTLAQVQLERLARHIFQNGSQVEGGYISYMTSKSLNLAAQYANTDIDVTQFIGKRITRRDGLSNVEAVVISGENASGSEPPTLMIKYLTSDEFVASDSIKVKNDTIYANVASSNISANGILADISDGHFFVKGFMARCPRQTIILEKYKTTANARIGFEVEESIVTAFDDTSLLDPAQDSSNYQGIGADRYKLDLIFAKRSYTSVDDDAFIELTRIEGGVQQKVLNIPYYAELEKTLARRTYDESGNYTVRPFKLNIEDDPDNSANIQATIDSGKGYVFGFEFEPVVASRILVEKPRETANVTLYDISTAFGNYLLGQDLRGSFDFSTMPVMDIHCIPYQFVSGASQEAYDSTKIGTTRLRTITHDSYGSISNANSYLSRIYIADTQLTSLTMNANSATASSVTLNSPKFSGNTMAYYNASLYVTLGTGLGQARSISSWNAITKTATVTPDFDTVPDTTSVISIRFGIEDAESMIRGGYGATTANLNISRSSKSDGTVNGDVTMSESAYSSLLFPFPQDYVKANTGLNNYQFRKVFTNRTFTSGVGTITADSGDALVGTGTLSDSIKTTNYTVIVTNNGGNTAWTNGAILPMATALGRSISVSGLTATIDAATSNTFVADVIASVEINSSTKVNPKSKTKIDANVTHAVTATANATFLGTNSNTAVYLKAGQVRIIGPNRVPSGRDSLYVSDVTKINAIYDLAGTAIVGGAALSSYSDVTSKYTLDTGQRDTFYDHAAIVLKNGVTAPTGPLVVCFDYYEHGAGTSDGYGFFSVDSYPDINTTDGYSAVPTYVDSKGEAHRLTDVIDFRPSRQNASNTSPAYTLNGIRIPTPNEEFTVNFEHYLPRRDIVIATKDRNFRYLKGVASTLPSPPNVPDDGMVLYRLNLNPYVLDSKNDIEVKYVDNRRFTMRDIGAIEKRVQNLEYYNTLNALEKAAESLSIRDANGLERTKYGIIADNFEGHSIGDVANPDYRCAIDSTTKRLRPFFTQGSFVMEYTASDSNVLKSGEILTLDYDETPFITQNTASKAESVTYFLVATFNGNMDISPMSDQWVNTNEVPDLVINENGVLDGWTANSASQAFGSDFGNWRTTSSRSSSSLKFLPGPRSPGNVFARTVTTDTVSTQSRTILETQTLSLGSAVTNISIVPYIRERDVFFNAYSMRPYRQVNFFFDGTDVTKYIERPNIVKVAQTVYRFDDQVGVNETVSFGANTAQVVLSEFDTDGNSLVYVANTNGYFTPGTTLTGAISGVTGTIISYEHYSGNVVSAMANSVVLAVGASNTANFYLSNTICFPVGRGAGQTTNITSYNATTRRAEVFPLLTTIPLANTKYSIGPNKVTGAGSIAGVYHLPSNGTDIFRTGEREFTITDATSSDATDYTTRAMTIYNALALQQDVRESVLSVQKPVVQTRTVTTPGKTFSGGTVSLASPSTGSKFIPGPTKVLSQSQRNAGALAAHTAAGGDPLSQTFTVDADLYPNGMFLSSVDLFFKAKDDNLPVWVEIRPTVNGFPSSGEILPYSISKKFPDQINISNNPSAGNTSTKTNFPFQSPVYLEAGKEYALTVLSDASEYEVYIAEMGKKQIGTDRLISEQPYSGSLFKSQNASVWTPFQFEDLMFVLNRCQFTTNEGLAYFENAPQTANTAFDVIYLQKQDLKIGGTEIDWAIKTTSNSTGAMGSFESIVADQDYVLSERKVISKANVRVSLQTDDAAISPVVVAKSVNLITVANEINNLPLSNTLITLVDDGSGYSNANNIAITVSGGGALTDANAYVGATDGSNITSIIVDSAGSRYYKTANIAFSGGGGSGANAIVASETNPSGGPAASRYITRRAILAEGFDGGDIRAYVTAYKPVGTEIYAYCKVKNEDDPGTFESKEWLHMPQATPANRFSTSDIDLIEFEYRPSLTANSLSYSSGGTNYTSFNEYAVKIVLVAETPQTVPELDDFRAIALPAGD